MEFGQVFLAAIALLIALLFLLTLSPSRVLGTAAAVIAMAVGLGAALLFASRPVVVPKIASAQVPAIGKVTSTAEDQMQAETDKLRREYKVLEIQGQRIATLFEAKTKEAEQAQKALEQAKSANQVDIGAAKAVNDQLERTQARLGTEVAERQRLESANRGLSEALQKAETALSQEKAAHERSRVELSKVATAPAVPAAPTVVAAPTPAPTPAGEPPARAATAVLAGLDKGTPPSEATATQPSGTMPPDPARQQLDAGGLVTPQFSVKLLPSSEIVAGRTGSYYGITLNDPATGKPFAFEKERYVLAGRDADFIAVTAAMQSKLAELLPAGVARIFYVHGFASSAAFTQSRAISSNRTSLNRVSFLPAVSKAAGQFKEPAAEQVLTGPYQNSHLALLRAANVRELLARTVKGPNIEIVAGELVPENNAQAHTFELILLAVWP